MRGQVTAFAIVGVLMLLGVLALFWVTRTPSTTPQGQGPLIALETCMEAESLLAVQEVGLAGGDPNGPYLQEIVNSPSALGMSGTGDARVVLHTWDPGLVDYAIDSQHYFNDDGIPPPEVTAYPTITTADEARTAITTAIRDAVSTCNSEVPEGDVTVSEVTFSDEHITFNAQVRQADRSPRTITMRLDLPFNRYHRILANTITVENENPMFVPATASAGQDFRIETYPDIDSEGSSLLVLSSRRPLIDNEPFYYRVIIENRPPVFLEEPKIILSCDTSSASPLPSITPAPPKNFVDPDEHDGAPTLDSCEELSGSYKYSFSSRGFTYEIEVTP